MYNFASKKNMNEVVRVVFYGRVSTEHEAQLGALQNQMQWYDDILAQHSNWTLVDRYIDEGITGTQAKKRPAFLRMMSDAQSDKFDLVVTREVCRFARNTVDTLVATRELKNINIEVYFVEDNIWTMDGDGELRLTLMATLAQEESRKVSERVRAGQKISRENGVLYSNGNILGYDYIKEGNTYRQNPEQAETVRMMFEMYRNGFSERKIQQELIRRQRKDGRGNVKWCASKINRILRNAAHAGFKVYNQSHINNFLDQKRIPHDEKDFIYVKGDWEPIVSEEVFYEVQRIRESKVLKREIAGIPKNKGKRATHIIWLRKLHCECGNGFHRNLWRINKKNNEKEYGYQCNNTITNLKRKFKIENGIPLDGTECDMKQIPEWKLYLMAKSIIEKTWTSRKETVVQALEMIADSYKSDSQQKIDSMLSLKNKLYSLEKKKETLIEMRTDCEISKEDYLNAYKKLEMQIELIKDEINDNSCDKDIYSDKKKMLHQVEKALNTAIDFSTNQISDTIIDEFIEKVIAYEDGSFKWYLNFTPTDEAIHCTVEGRKNSNPQISYLFNQNGTNHNDKSKQTCICNHNTIPFPKRSKILMKTCSPPYVERMESPYRLPYKVYYVNVRLSSEDIIVSYDDCI